VSHALGLVITREMEVGLVTATAAATRSDYDSHSWGLSWRLYMTLADTMRNIKTRGKPGAAAIYRRHGVTEPTVGMSYADLGVLVKKIGVDHTLALGLWDTGLHDARVVATRWPPRRG
jgi:hypothetical protein